MTSDDERERWLRAARPATSADDGWVDSEDAAATLRRIHDAIPQAVRARRRKVWVATGRLGLIGATAAALVIAAVATGPSKQSDRPRGQATSPTGPTGPTAPLGPVPTQTELAAYTDCSQMLAGLRTHTAAHVTPYGLDYTYPYAYGGRGLALAPEVPGKAVDSAAGPESAPAHSSTNNQVATVDEPDTIKTDGKRIVAMSGGVLRIIDAASHTITGSLDLSLYSGANGAQLLVDGDRALVILGSYGYPDFGFRPAIEGPIYYQYAGLAGYVLVDLSGAPSVISTMQTKGSPVDARLVGSSVRFVVSSSPTFAFPALTGKHTDAERRAANKAVVLHAPLSSWAPKYTLTDQHGSRTLTVPCEDVRHPASYTGLSMSTIYSVDMSKGFGDLAPTSLAADGSTVYSTTRNLYIASTGPKHNTQVHRYDVSGTGRPTYLGSGTVPGYLLNSYSLSDYAGYLRVVTTSFGTHGNSASGIYELDDATLHIVGGYGGLGRHEQVYAVRFLDALAYVVTFKQVDPLYVLDLHNPRHPRPIGELRTTGYSSYLHDVGPGLLFSVGAQLDKYNEPSGLKLSLLDVSSSHQPRVLSTLVRKNSWSGQLDPHAFLFWPATNDVVVPVQSWTGDQGSGALIVKISGHTVHTVGLVRNPATLNSDASITRVLVIGDTLWTMSDTGLQSSDLDSLAKQNWIPFS